MKLLLSDLLLYTSVFILVSAITVIIYFAFYSKRFKNMFDMADRKILSEFSSFISSISGPLFAIGGSLIIYSTIIDQNHKDELQDYRDEVNHFETIFFKNIEYHRDNNKSMSVVSPISKKIREGRSAFINLNQSLRDVVKVIKKRANYLNDNEVANIAFQFVYIGIDDPTERKLLEPTLNKYVNKISIDSLIMDCDDLPHHDSVSHYLSGNKSRLTNYFNQFFNTLRLLDRFVARFNFSKEDQEFYANLLLQHNGHYEKSIISFYLFSDSASKSEKLLADKYIKHTINDKIELNDMLKKGQIENS